MSRKRPLEESSTEDAPVMRLPIPATLMGGIITWCGHLKRKLIQMVNPYAFTLPKAVNVNIFTFGAKRRIIEVTSGAPAPETPLKPRVPGLDSTALELLEPDGSLRTSPVSRAPSASPLSPARRIATPHGRLSPTRSPSHNSLLSSSSPISPSYPFKTALSHTSPQATVGLATPETAQFLNSSEVVRTPLVPAVTHSLTAQEKDAALYRLQVARPRSSSKALGAPPKRTAGTLHGKKASTPHRKVSGELGRQVVDTPYRKVADTRHREAGHKLSRKISNTPRIKAADPLTPPEEPVSPVAQPIAPIPSPTETTPDSTTQIGIASPYDDDVEMLDAPPAKKSKTVRFAPASVITGKIHIHPPKYFYQNLKIDERPPNFDQWRSPEKIDFDDSLLFESPVRHFGDEQDLEPTPQSPRSASRAVLDGILTQFAKPDAPAEMVKSPESATYSSRYKHFHSRADSFDRKMQQIREQKLLDAMAKEAARIERANKEREAAEAKEAQKKYDEARRLSLENAWKRVIIYHELPQKCEDSINAAMSNTNPSATLTKRGQLTRHDFGTLLPQRVFRGDSPSGWLNDNIVNTTLEMMTRHALDARGHDMKSKTQPAPYWAFNSAWYKTIQEVDRNKKNKPVGLEKFGRWARKRGVNLGGKNLLQAEKLFFPVCSGSHWTLVVVYPKRRHIEYLNSMEGDLTGARITKPIMAWIAHELGDDFHYGDWEHINRRSLAQSDASCCGVFTIMNALAILRDVQPGRSVCQRDMQQARRQIAAVLLNGGFEGDFAFEVTETYDTPNWKGYFFVRDRQGKGWVEEVVAPNFWANVPVAHPDNLVLSKWETYIRKPDDPVPSRVWPEHSP